MSERERGTDKTPKVEYNEDAGGLVSAEPLCADLSGKLVPCDSPEANTQVAGAGAVIPPKVAKLYGLKAARGKDEEPDKPDGEAARPGEKPTQLPAEKPAEEVHPLGEDRPTQASRTVRSVK